jgi:mRNA interferase RelE/StbE
MKKTVSVIYSTDSLKFLKKLDASIAKRIVTKIKDNTEQKNILNRAKPLQGDLSGKYRYRIGDYRAIFIIDEKGNLVLLTVLNIKHRKDIYR